MSEVDTRRRIAPLALVLLLMLGACATGSVGAAPPIDPNMITEAELELRPERDVLELIANLRPRWLQIRTSRTFLSTTRVSVLVDDVRQTSGTDILRTMRIERVREIRYMSASDATTRYGPDMAGGAILVYRKDR